MEIKAKINYLIANLNDYLLLLSSLLIIWGAAIYYIYALNWLGIALVLILTIISFFILKGFLFTPSTENNYLILNKKSLIFWLVYLLFFGLSFFVLKNSQSDRALISPWQVVPETFFLYYSLASLALVLILSRKTISATEKIIALSGHYFLSLSVAIIVYKIGYGFDPFIHQATMELIDKKGLVNPKPPYYLGEYGLLIIIHKISGWSLYWLNKFLLPLSAAIFLPLTLYRFLKDDFLSILFILILTFTPLIITTPQNLSYLFLILTILAGLGRKNLIWAWILAAATTAIHPLTGLPAGFWVMLLTLTEYQKRWHLKNPRLITGLILILNALSLPLALFIGAGKNIKEFSWRFDYLLEPFKNIFQAINTAGSENWLTNLAYFYAFNRSLILVLLIAGALFYFYRRKNRPDWKHLLLINLSLVVSYILASQIVFVDLINYEQSNYASRILTIIVLFSLPWLLLALKDIIKKIEKTPCPARLTFLSGALLLLGISLYLSYPRLDKYFNSRGYSLSQNDLLAVRQIAQSSGRPYLVLANQQVSVAALKELGFDHYHQSAQGPIYFYPIPTGGPLYQYYLQMVYQKPARETMFLALDLAGVDEGYLVINKYWHQSSRIIGEAKLTADSWSAVNNDVYIFRYERRP